MSKQTVAAESSSSGPLDDDKDIFDEIDENLDKKLDEESETGAAEEEKERVYQRWQFTHFHKTVVLAGERHHVDGNWVTIVPRVSLRPQAYKNGVIDLDNLKIEDVSCDVGLERLTKNSKWMTMIVQRLIRRGVKMLTSEHDAIVERRKQARKKLEDQLKEIDKEEAMIEALQAKKRKELLANLDG